MKLSISGRKKEANDCHQLSFEVVKADMYTIKSALERLCVVYAPFLSARNDVGQVQYFPLRLYVVFYLNIASASSKSFLL